MRVFRVADHVGADDFGRVEFLDDVRGWDADGGDEERGFFFDDDVDQGVQLAVGVVVAGEVGG